MLTANHTKNNPNPSYTSNCTEEDKQNGIDFLFILGKDNPGENTHAEDYAKIKADCEKKGLKYIILGNGKDAVNLDDIEHLPKVRNTLIYGHGIVLKNNHMISLTEGDVLVKSMEIIQKLQDQTDCKNFFVSSCFGGKIADDFKNNKLEKGTFLSAYSAPDEVSWLRDSSSIVSILINKAMPGKIVPIVSTTAELIKTIPQTMVFACQLDNILASKTLMRKERGVFLEVERFCEYQFREFSDFILKNALEKEFPNVSLEEEQEPFKMSLSEIQAFQKQSILNHARHNDTEITNAIMTNTPSVIYPLFTGNKDQNKNLLNTVREFLIHRTKVSEDARSGIDIALFSLAANLAGIDLNNVKLRGVPLIGANLTGADFTSADLAGADLTGATLNLVKGLDVNNLVKAKSIMNIKMDTESIKNLSNEDQKLLKKKMVNDYFAYFKKEDEISDLTRNLKSLIEDNEHILKYERISIYDYGVTTSYKEVLKAGVVRLTDLLKEQQTQFHSLSNLTHQALSLIANTVSEFDVSYMPDFLRQGPVEKTVGEILKEAIPKPVIVQSLEIKNRNDLIIFFKKIPEIEKHLDYAKYLNKKLDDIYLLIDVIGLLQPKDQLEFAKHINAKLPGIEEVLMVIQVLSGKDKLEYAKLAKDMIKDKIDLQSVLDELPKEEWPSYVSLVINQFKTVDDLEWLSKELKQSPETVRLLMGEIKNRDQSMAKIPDNQSTTTLFQELGIKSHAPQVALNQYQSKPKPENDRIIKGVSNKDDTNISKVNYKPGR